MSIVILLKDLYRLISLQLQLLFLLQLASVTVILQACKQGPSLLLVVIHFNIFNIVIHVRHKAPGCHNYIGII